MASYDLLDDGHVINARISKSGHRQGIRQRLDVADTGSHTYTAKEILTNALIARSLTADTTDTLPSAVDIIAGLGNNAVVGFSYDIIVINLSTSYALTINGGSGITFEGVQIYSSKQATTITLVVTSLTTMKAVSVSTSHNFGNTTGTGIKIVTSNNGTVYLLTTDSFSGTATITVPPLTDTLAVLGTAQTFTGQNIFTSATSSFRPADASNKGLMFRWNQSFATQPYFTFGNNSGTETWAVTSNGASTSQLAFNLSGTGNRAIFTSSGLSLPGTTNQLLLGTTNTTTITSPAPAAPRVVTIPDAGASSSVVLTEGTQTLNGITNFTNAVNFQGAVNQFAIQPSGSGNKYTFNASLNPTQNTTISFKDHPGVSATTLMVDKTGVNVTQITSVNTAVTANGRAGRITMFAALAAGTTGTFDVNNDYVTTATKVLLWISNTVSATAKISPTVVLNSTGSQTFNISVTNNDAANALAAAAEVQYLIV